MSVHDSLDPCESLWKFEKAGILLTLGFYPTQKSCLEELEKKPHLTEKISLKFWDLEQKIDNEAGREL